MTNYVRIILGFSILGCLIGLFLFFKSDEKKTLTEKIRLDELESLSIAFTLLIMRCACFSEVLDLLDLSLLYPCDHLFCLDLGLELEEVILE